MGVVKRQGIKNTITGYAGILIGFVNLLVIQPNFLTKEELGLTRILYSFSLLLAMFVPLGISNATIRFFPQFKDPEKKNHGYFAFMNLFPLVGFVFTALIVWLFRDFIMNQYRRESPLFLEYFDYVFPLLFFNSFIGVLGVYCNVNYKSTIPSFLNDVVIRLITIGLVSVYFLKWLDLHQFIQCFVGIFAFQMLALLFYIFIFDKPGFRIDWAVIRKKNIRDLIQYGSLLWFASISSIGLKYFDSIMIGKFMPLAFVGIYTIAAFIPTVIEAPLNAFERIASVRISFAWTENDHEQIRQLYHKSSLYMFLAGSFLFLNVNVNIHTLLTFLPAGYQQGEMVVLIISLGTLFNMATGLNASILLNSDKFRYAAFFLVFLAVLVLALQMVFIPLYGIVGAALATCSASLMFNLLICFTVWKFFKLQPFDHKNLRVLISLLVCFLTGWLLPHLENRFMDIGMRTAVVSLLYFLFIYFQNIVPEFHKFLPWEKKPQA